MKFSDLLQGLGDLVYPPGCAACDSILPPGHPGALCIDCRQGVEWIVSPLCRVCGRMFYNRTERDSLCGQCLRRPPSYTVARSVVRYGSSVKILIHQLKYAKNLSVLQGISELVYSFDMGRFREADYILPVPLHIERLRERGWNQSTILAKLFFPETGKKIKVDWLIKKENSQEQTGLSGTKRRLNLKSVFDVSQKAQTCGATVCLVDDVFTTGTTVQECSKVLKQAGAVEILVLTLARADIPRGK